MLVGSLCFFLPALATIRMPESFDVTTDFDEKEKWIVGKRKLRCDVCKLIVDNAFEKVGDTTNEDVIYDFVEGICENKSLYDSVLILKNPWRLKDAGGDKDERTDHQKLWQSHAMQETCGDFVKPYDDEIKDAFLEKRRKSAGKDSLVVELCTKVGNCSGSKEEL